MYHRPTLIFIALLFAASGQAGEIFDANGKRIFCTEETGATRQVEMRDGRTGTYHEIRLVHEPSGRAFEWDARWDQVTSVGVFE